MVVIVIAALLMGVVVMSFPDGNTDRLKKQGQRFVTLMSYAQDDAILQSQDLALAVDDAGYSFYRRAGDSWEVYSDKPFASRKMDSDITTKMILEGTPLKLKVSKKTKPQIFIYSSGEITPFEYHLSNTEKSTFSLVFDAAGNVTQVFKNNEQSK